MDLDPAQAEQMPALMPAPAEAEDVRNAASFQFDRCWLVPYVFLVLGDFLGY